MRMEQLGFKVTRTPYYTLIHTYSVLLPSIFCFFRPNDTYIPFSTLFPLLFASSLCIFFLLYLLVYLVLDVHALKITRPGWQWPW
jgi:hypothetical protein